MQQRNKTIGMAKIEDDDEFFGDQDGEDNGSFGGLSEYELKAKEEEIKKLAYLQAYDEKKELRLQEGFEGRYQETFDSAFRIGKLLGQLTGSERILQEQEQRPVVDGIEDESVSSSMKATRKVRTFITSFQDRVNKKDIEDATAELEILEQELTEIVERKI